MLKKSLSDIFTTEDLNKKYANMIFFLEEKNERKLYRIEMDNITKKFTPFLITSLPSLYYEYNEKQKHMISFLERNHIHFIIEDNKIVIFNPQIEEYNIVEAPVYIKNNDTYYRKGVYTSKLPTQKMGEAAYDVFERFYKKIKAEEVMFDFMQLTMDGGKSAYFEEYSKSDLYYLNKNRFLLFELSFNPNTTNTPYNEYTNNCRIIPEEYDYYNGSYFVVFDKEMIAKYSVNGNISVTLPTEVASIVIGKAGENIKSLVYLLGINKLFVNAELKEAI